MNEAKTKRSVIMFLALLGGRLLGVGCLLVRRQTLFPAISRSAWSQLLVLATFRTTFPLLLVVVGLTSINASVGGVLLQVQGPATAFFSMLWLRERLTWRQGVGTGLLFIGSLLVILRDGPTISWQGGSVGALVF